MQPHLFCVGSATESTPNYRSADWINKSDQRCLLQYTVEGCGMISYLGDTYSVEAGKAFIFSKKIADACFYYPPEATEPWSFVYCEFLNLQNAVDQLNSRYGPVYEFGTKSFLIQKLLYLLENQQRQKGMVSGRESFRFCTDLIEEMDRIVETKDRGENGSLAIIARDLIFEHREEPFSLTGLAEKLSVTPEHLCREFRRHLNTTPKQYHDQLRAKLMQEWLINNDQPTKQVAQRFGFENATNFIAFFKKHTGQTPGEFRRSCIR